MVSFVPSAQQVQPLACYDLVLSNVAEVNEEVRLKGPAEHAERLRSKSDGEKA